MCVVWMKQLDMNHHALEISFLHIEINDEMEDIEKSNVKKMTGLIME